MGPGFLLLGFFHALASESKKGQKIKKPIWRVPNPPGAKPLVAERALWRSSQSRVTGGQQPAGNPYRFLSHFFCIPDNPCATPIVTRGEGSFSYQGVSTRGVRG